MKQKLHPMVGIIKDVCLLLLVVPIVFWTIPAIGVSKFGRTSEEATFRIGMQACGLLGTLLVDGYTWVMRRLSREPSPPPVVTIDAPLPPEAVNLSAMPGKANTWEITTEEERRPFAGNSHGAPALPRFSTMVVAVCKWVIPPTIVSVLWLLCDFFTVNTTSETARKVGITFLVWAAFAALTSGLLVMVVVLAFAALGAKSVSRRLKRQ